MALPPIRHARTRDGVHIAFHTMGEGHPCLLLFPYHVNHLALNWEVGLHRRGMEFLADHFTVVNLDFRGAGLSERSIRALSLESFVLDIEAVLASIDSEQVSICAMGPAAIMAAHFAAVAPHRVRRMVFVHGGDSEANRRVLGLRAINPAIEAQMRGMLLGGMNDRQNMATVAAVSREALGFEALQYWQQLLAETRLEDITPKVRCATLCLHASGDELIPAGTAQISLGGLSNATFKVVPAATGMHIWRDQAALRAILTFLSETPDGTRRTVHARGSTRPAQGYPAGLTWREAEILRLVAEGQTNRQIGEVLFISLHTVSHHLRSIFAKTGASNRTEAATFAHQHKLCN